MNADEAQAAAEWLREDDPHGHVTARARFLQHAARLELAERTPGQVLYGALNGTDWWASDSPATRERYERVAAAVIAHHEATR